MSKKWLLVCGVAALAISSCGGGGGGSNGGSSPPPTASPNRAPSITTADPAPDIIEGDDSYAYTETASDPDGDTLTFSLGGPDADDLSINASTGEVTFRQVPDYENPADAVQDNTYTFTVIVRDGAAQTSVSRVINVENRFDSVAILSVAAQVSPDTRFYTEFVHTYANGDLDGDGVDDLLITHGHGSLVLPDISRVHTVDGQPVDETRFWLSGPGYEGEKWITRENATRVFVYVDGGDDFDGDGVDDMLITSQAGGGKSTSKLAIIKGQSLSGLSNDPAATEDVVSNDAYLLGPGHSDFDLFAITSFLGDLDGNGRPEIGVPYKNGPGCDDASIAVRGEALLATGQEQTVYDLGLSGDSVTMDVSTACPTSRSLFELGDLNGDGKLEIAANWPVRIPEGFSQYFDIGSVIIIDGADLSANFGGTPRLPEDLTALTLKGPATPADGGLAPIRKGEYFSVIGDIDSDTRPDIFIAGERGDAYILFGGALYAGMGSEQDLETFTANGGGVALRADTASRFRIMDAHSLGDLSGDNVPDLAMLTYNVSTGLYGAYVVSGARIAARAGGAWPVADLLAGDTIYLHTDSALGLFSLEVPGDINDDGMTDAFFLGKLPPDPAEHAVDIFAISGSYLAEQWAAGAETIDLRVYLR